MTSNPHITETTTFPIGVLGGLTRASTVKYDLALVVPRPSLT
jgi:hypothetical protein